MTAASTQLVSCDTAPAEIDRVKPVCKSKKEYIKLLQEQVEELSALQRRLYASNRYAVQLIFQAMDAPQARTVLSGA